MNVPKLRFPGFINPWDSSKLELLTTNITAGKSKLTKEEGKGYPIIGSRGIIGFSNSFDYEGSFLLVARVGANAGKISTYIGKCKITDNTIFFESKSLEKNFLNELLVKQNLTKKAFGSGQPLIKASDLKNIIIRFPSKDEQKKISTFLVSLDHKIQLQQEKIDLLKEQRKGFMQKIFTQELRFSAYNELWSGFKVSDVATLINGRAYKKEELLSEGKFRVLRVGNFFTNDSWYYSDLELDDNKYAEKEDLLYAWSASFGPKIWREEKVIYHYHIWKVVPNTKLVYRDFLYHWFIFDKTRIIADKNGSTLVHITKGGLEETTIEVPCLDEQKAIIEFLNKIDRKISLNEETLATLESQKLALMQQMFI